MISLFDMTMGGLLTIMNFWGLLLSLVFVLMVYIDNYPETAKPITMVYCWPSLAVLLFLNVLIVLLIRAKPVGLTYSPKWMIAQSILAWLFYQFVINLKYNIY